MGEQFCLRWNNHQSTVVSVVESMLISDSLTDCTLAAEGKELKAHKLILTACSPYFESLLCQHHHDKGHPIIILKDVKFYELKAMLDYMYKGEVNISQDQLDSFIKTAESLQIKGLTDQGGGSNNEGDSRDVGSTPKRKPPASRPDSPPAGAAPAREGSPSAKRRRRHTQPPQTVLHEEAPSTPAAPDPARLAVVPKVEPPDPMPSQQQQPAGPPVKSEMLEDTGPTDDIEDLTLDDDDEEDYGGMGDTSQPGTSFENKFEGNSQASQDFSQWPMAGDRSTDEVFMAAQEAINNQSNSQDKELSEEEKITVIVVPDGYQEEIKREEDTFDCPKCGTKYLDGPSFRRHLKRHLKDSNVTYPFRCENCDSAFKLERTMRVHQKWECGKEPKFTCSICFKKFHLEQYLRQHLTKHAKREAKKGQDNFNCPSCNRLFKQRSNLETHIKFECGKDPSFECEVCGEKFHFRAHLNEHKLLSHTEATMGNNLLKQAPERNSEEIKYRCKLCPRAFTRVGSLNYHVSRKHSGKALQIKRDPEEYPYQCGECGNRYRNSTQLCRHRRWECGKEPMFQCTQCVKKFHHRHGLKQHIRLHITKTEKQISSRDYCCDKCGKRYKLKSSLNNHTKWECGKEPVFACTICFVKFSYKGNLKKHILTKHINDVVPAP